MTEKSSHLALSPLIKLLDRSAAVPHQAPTAKQDSTRFPRLPWDLRTIIIVFPPEAPFYFLNLNILLGLTGIPFDRPENLCGIGTNDAFDLQFCLEGKNRHATYKQYHSITKELEYEPDKVEIRLGERLDFSGAWPDYRVVYRQPENDLSIEMNFYSQQNYHWWAHFGGIYCHYTSFCECKMEWSWGGQSGATNVTALHDHGWGRNLLPLRLPIRVFRYEVMRVGERGHAISLWTEAPPGLKVKNVGLFRRDEKESMFMPNYSCEVLEWDTFENYAGKKCRIPRRWQGKQKSSNAEFQYEATRTTEPRPVIGNGFMYGFDYQGELKDPNKQELQGQGYVEQLGLLAG